MEACRWQRQESFALLSAVIFWFSGNLLFSRRFFIHQFEANRLLKCVKNMLSLTILTSPN